MLSHLLQLGVLSIPYLQQLIEDCLTARLAILRIVDPLPITHQEHEGLKGFGLLILLLCQLRVLSEELEVL